MPPSSAVYVCQGKACRKPDSRGDLLGDLTRVADVHMVKCQKVCHGVVVGVCLDNRLEWFERISKEKSRTGSSMSSTPAPSSGSPSSSRSGASPSSAAARPDSGRRRWPALGGASRWLEVVVVGRRTRESQRSGRRRLEKAGLTTRPDTDRDRT